MFSAWLEKKTSNSTASRTSLLWSNPYATQRKANIFRISWNGGALRETGRSDERCGAPGTPQNASAGGLNS
jgi:hypothetical protein